MTEFNQVANIKVFGVGGGGSNAVNRMVADGVKGGVKIYEYESGFVHSKVFISDDTYATVGTINLDYRSLYLHFENGTLLYKSKKILDVKQNFIDTLSKCKEIQIEDTHVNIVKGLFLSIIRIFSPLL